MGAHFDQLRTEVQRMFRSAWQVETTQSVPEPEQLQLLKNHGKKLEAVVLYADIASSTELVDHVEATRAAELYEVYLYCAGQAIRQQGGNIVAYDGDRIMALFVGGTKNTDAARAALKINGAVVQIIRPAQLEQFKTGSYQLNHRVGIDRSEMLAVRVGVRGDNDITWIGRAANHAAKIGDYGTDNSPLVLTADVYNWLKDEAKVSKGSQMWSRAISTYKGRSLYTSSWYIPNY